MCGVELLLFCCRLFGVPWFGIEEIKKKYDPYRRDKITIFIQRILMLQREFGKETTAQ